MKTQYNAIDLVEPSQAEGRELGQNTTSTAPTCRKTAAISTMGQFVRHGIVAAILGVTVLTGCKDSTDKKVPVSAGEISQDQDGNPMNIPLNDYPFPKSPHPIWDDHPEYFEIHKDGKLKGETRTMLNGEKIVRDVGALQFYRVTRGDTIGSIRRRLLRYPEFAYLHEQREKINSFNIPNKSLRAGMLIPIPMPEQDRQMTDEQFANYAYEAIQEMKAHPEYGSKVREILQKISERELLASIISYAKKESGGKPLGQFELHRWEKRYRVFSFSMMHVMMTGPGLKARKQLGLTEGQLYHPKNAAKLFLAFYIEKAGHFFTWPLGSTHVVPIEQFFPIDRNWTLNAVFYNGPRWKANNYVKDMQRYLGQARDLVGPIDDTSDHERISASIGEAPKATAQQPATTHSIEAIVKETHGKASDVSSGHTVFPNVQSIPIGGFNLFNVIRESNYQNSVAIGKPSILSHDRNIRKLSLALQTYLRKKYGKTTYYKDDAIGVGEDKKGAFLSFERNGNRAIIRLQ